MADNLNPTDDERLFELLDRYVALLQKGDQGQCAGLLAANPQLCELAPCLEALASFSGALASDASPAAMEDRSPAAGASLTRTLV
ncbi:MAG TPA: hypothetical protein VKU82_13725, partial [Planctomycetaceae bacterium]|nr:hypothetical protein [Planctomycetaceae bacterium]